MEESAGDVGTVSFECEWWDGYGWWDGRWDGNGNGWGDGV